MPGSISVSVDLVPSKQLQKYGICHFIFDDLLHCTGKIFHWYTLQISVEAVFFQACSAKGNICNLLIKNLIKKSSGNFEIGEWKSKGFIRQVKIAGNGTDTTDGLFDLVLFGKHEIFGMVDTMGAKGKTLINE